MDLFEYFDAEIISIAQLERDPAQLPRITEFVHNTFPVVADPDQATREPFEIFGIYLIDKEGIVQTYIPGVKEARPRLDMVINELAIMTGKELPSSLKKRVEDFASESSTAPPVTGPELSNPDDLLTISWMWSHNAVRPKDRLKLAFVATPAYGYHVYGSVEEGMTPFEFSLDLPEGIELVESIKYPKSHVLHDPVLKKDLMVYDEDMPMPVMYFQIGDDVPAGEYEIKATLRYQGCNDSVCLPPATREVVMPLKVVGAKGRRGTVAGYQDW